ncbi:Uncharacterised protein [uncultured archaeon]|nr:Uncharacterised protein [uncultured archaeon]
MKKKVIIGISICAVFIFILGSSTNVEGYQTVQSSNQKTMNTYDDVDIDIHAGVYGKTNGNYGLGYVLSITNNLNEIITGNIRIYYNSTDNKTVSFTNISFQQPPLFVVRFVNIDWLHSLYPILTLTVTVKINETSQSVSRSGKEIGPFVFFSH